MFKRITRFKVRGKIYEYVRIVESYREKGKKHQRVIANLGRVESLPGKIDKLVDGLREHCRGKFIKPGEIDVEETPIWGTILVARRLWNELGLREIIGRHCRKGKRGLEIEETAFVLVASSLVNPSRLVYILKEKVLINWQTMENQRMEKRETGRYYWFNPIQLPRLNWILFEEVFEFFPKGTGKRRSIFSQGSCKIFQ